MENPNYYAVIPANVRYDKELKPMAKLLYGEIAALAQKDGKCWATNNYFAELYGMAKASISRLISDLEKRGYIKIEIVYKEGTHEIINRYIQICGEGIHKKVDTPIDENVYTPIDEKVKENNTSNEQYKNEQYKVNNKREEVSKDTSKRSGEFVDIYSRECFNLPQIKKLTDDRKRAIQKFSKQYTLKDWEEVCKIANTSEFLCGTNDRGWKADFDFLIKPNKATNVLEGKYSGKARGKPEETSNNPFLRVLREMEENNDEKGNSTNFSDNANDISTILSDYTVE